MASGVSPLISPPSDAGDVGQQHPLLGLQRGHPVGDRLHRVGVEALHPRGLPRVLRHRVEQQRRQVLGDAQAEQVDRDTGHDVVDRERHRGDGVQQPAERAEHRPADHRGPRPPLVAGPGRAPGAEDHHALEADVDHAGAFGPQPAQPGQQDRQQQQHRGLRGAARGELELPGQGGGDRQDHHARPRRSAPSGPTGAARAGGGRRWRRPRRAGPGRAPRWSCRTPCRPGPATSPAGGRRGQVAQLGGHPALLGGHLVAPDDLVGHHHRQHHGPLHDQHDLPRHPDVVQGQRRLVQEGPQQRAERDAQRMVAAQQRDRDAGEAVALRRGQRVGVVAAEQLGQPDQARPPPRTAPAPR